MSACERDKCLCCGRGHWCEPESMPTALGQTWTCPNCGQEHEAFDVLGAEHVPDMVKRRTPAGTIGWRSVARRQS